MGNATATDGTCAASGDGTHASTEQNAHEEHARRRRDTAGAGYQPRARPNIAAGTFDMFNLRGAQAAKFGRIPGSDPGSKGTIGGPVAILATMRALVGWSIGILALSLFPSSASADEGDVLLEFHFQPVPGAQIAIWLEDADGNFVQVSAGNTHTCGVTIEGMVKCWGADTQGILSPPEGTFAQVSTSWRHACDDRCVHRLATTSSQWMS